MTLTRSPIKPGAPLQRHTRLVRKTPLRQRSTKPSASRRRKEQEGRQWALCHHTECVSCFHASWRRRYGDLPVDWKTLPPAIGGNHGHHEPPRSRGGKDRHCLPLCPKCHESRHRLGVTAFWLCIDYPGALAEMTRRVYPRETTKPVVDATASETNP